MVSLIAGAGYKRTSNTLSVNSAQKINKTALTFAKTKLEIALSSRLRTSIFKIFPGPAMVGPIVDTGCLARYRLQISKEHCFKTLEQSLIGDNRTAYQSRKFRQIQHYTPNQRVLTTSPAGMHPVGNEL